MTIDALRLEVKKDKWEQLQNGTYKLQVTVNPADLNDNADDVLLQFIKAGMGDRFMMGVAKIGPDEQPEQPISSLSKPAQASPSQEKPKRPPATTRAEKARRLCGVTSFQEYAMRYFGGTTPAGLSPYETASRRVKIHCGVASKSELDINVRAAVKWDELLTDYEQSTGRMAEKHQ